MARHGTARRAGEPSDQLLGRIRHQRGQFASSTNKGLVMTNSQQQNRLKFQKVGEGVLVHNLHLKF